MKSGYLVLTAAIGLLDSSSHAFQQSLVGSSVSFSSSSALFSAHRARTKSAYTGTQVMDDNYSSQRDDNDDYFRRNPVPLQQQQFVSAPPDQFLQTKPSASTGQKPWYEDPRGSTYTDLPIEVAPAPIQLYNSPALGNQVQPPLVAPPALPMPPQEYMEPNIYGEELPKRFDVRPLYESLAPPLKHDGVATEYPTKALIHGGSRRTWSSVDPHTITSEIWLQSERPRAPLHADVKYHVGPSNTPRQMRVFSDDGYLRPVKAYFTKPATSQGYTNMIDVINIASMEMPMTATISQSRDFTVGGQSFQGDMNWQKVQGKDAIRTYSIDAKTDKVKINLETDGLPLMANIEVLQGPGDVRQLIQVQSDDGSPWEGIVATPGIGASVIIRNVGPLEFPLRCSVESQGFY